MEEILLLLIKDHACSMSTSCLRSLNSSQFGMRMGSGLHWGSWRKGGRGERVHEIPQHVEKCQNVQPLLVTRSPAHPCADEVGRGRLLIVIVVVVLL